MKNKLIHSIILTTFMSVTFLSLNISNSFGSSTNNKVSKSSNSSNLSNLSASKSESQPSNTKNHYENIQLKDIDFALKDVEVDKITKENIIYDLEELKKVMVSSAVDPIINNVDIEKDLSDLQNNKNLENKTVAKSLAYIFSKFGMSHTNINYWGVNKVDDLRLFKFGQLYEENSEKKFMDIMDLSSGKYQKYSGNKYLNKKTSNSKQELEIKTEIIEKDKIALIKIDSFLEISPESLNNLDAFLKEIKDYPNLIIDVRGNKGGYPYVWKSILKKLIKEDLNVVSYMAYKKSPITDKLIEENNSFIKYNLSEENPNNWEYKNIKISEVNSLPDTMKNLDPLVTKIPLRYFKIEDKVEPQGSVGFKGKIYVLADNTTYSATDNFLHYVKNSKVAKIIGSRGNGGGVGGTFGLYFYQMPYTGIIVQMETALAFNDDGSLNNKKGTLIDYDTPLTKELDKALKLIKSENP